MLRMRYASSSSTGVSVTRLAANIGYPGQSGIFHAPNLANVFTIQT